MQTTVITGANRGIGLALCTLLKERGRQVIAACRTSSPELDALGVEVVAGADVARDDGVATLRDAVGTRRIELLINNAGILRWDDNLDTLDFEAVREQLEVNALGPLRVTQALRGSLVEGAKVAMITSRMGSITDNGSGAAYGYRMSKAALNMASSTLALELKKHGIALAILHPGMVSTGMIGFQGQIEPDEAARGLLARIDALSLATSGGFWHQNGERLPW
ncbi:MAG TPA: SDR family oxidoreductase [Polyangiales bacterium]|nr:SDR family oxidoreductase [Polyangiales bacterium]